MCGFMAVKHAFLNHDHSVPVGATIHHTGPDAAAGALSNRDDGIHSQVVQVSRQGSAPEAAGRRLSQECLAVYGRDFIDDVIFAASPVGGGWVGVNRPTVSLASAPSLYAATVKARHVDDGYPGVSDRLEQCLDMGNSIPRRQSATRRPGLDPFQQRLGVVTEDPPVQVHQQQGRLFAKPHGLAPGERQVGLVLLREKRVPYSLSHLKSPNLRRMTGRHTAKCEYRTHRSDAAYCQESTTAVCPRQWSPLRLAGNNETC